MRNHWLIQLTGLRRPDALTDRLIKALGAAGCTWSDIGVIPFTNEITNWEAIPSVPVFVHCSTKVLEIFSRPVPHSSIFVGASHEDSMRLYMAMKTGLFYDRTRFDQTVYGRVNTARGRLDDFLVNGVCSVLSLRAAMDATFAQDRFIKPGPDLKLFSGSILQAGQTLRELLATQTVSSSFDDSMDDRVIVAPICKILGEWRFFVVNGVVVTGTQYRKHGVLAPSAFVPDHVTRHAQVLADLYQPAQAFTMDLALTHDLELQIMEYNCVNCSGLYEADATQLALALKET